MNRKIINIDKNGNIIEDLSKVRIPTELSKSIFEILNPGLEPSVHDEEKEKEAYGYEAAKNER